MGRAASSINGLDTFTYSYVPDTARLSGVTSANGPQVSFGYLPVNNNLNVQQITNRNRYGVETSVFYYGYDALDRITSWNRTIGGVASTQSAKYDDSSRLIELVREAGAQGKQWNYRYDRTHNRINDQLETWTAGGSTLQRQQHEVDAMDRVVGQQPGGALYVSGTASAQAQVTQSGNKPAALTSPSHKFSAWVEATSGGQGQLNLKNWHSASVNQTANPSGLASILGTPSTSYTYDANGNTIQSVVTFPNSLTLTANYGWDHKNQLVRVEFVGYASSEFSYDGLGRRVRIVEKDAGGAVTSDRHYLWDGLRIAQERNAVGTPATIFYPQGEMRTGNVKYYYVRDHQGSVREVHDAAGNVVARYDYDPYGYPEIVSESVQFDFLYTGHLYHRMSGLYLAPYRAYNPQTGKWLSEEPLGLDGPNMYHYAINSPLSFYDPTGLITANQIATKVEGWIDSAESSLEMGSSGKMAIMYNTVLYTAADIGRGVADVGRFGVGAAEAVEGYSVNGGGPLSGWGRAWAVAQDGLRGSSIVSASLAPFSGLRSPLFRQGITDPTKLTPKAIAGGTQLAGLFNRTPFLKFGSSWNPDLGRLDFALRPYGGMAVPHLHLAPSIFRMGLGLPSLLNGWLNDC